MHDDEKEPAQSTIHKWFYIFSLGRVKSFVISCTLLEALQWVADTLKVIETVRAKW